MKTQMMTKRYMQPAIFLTHVINNSLQRGKLVGKNMARKTKRRNSSSLSHFNIGDLGGIFILQC